MLVSDGTLIDHCCDKAAVMNDECLRDIVNLLHIALPKTEKRSRERKNSLPGKVWTSSTREGSEILADPQGRARAVGDALGF